ncbi:hypothetical protein [Ruania alba]|uniref:Uncharacterized protein n=1 Tax=Ruania alba TaxID=648782 RepID=A0A1H5N094_9MICO|nr:hypothetical protein [Ruania alba]SEE94995.1 hypothetical protein SAMN04488554_3809 [Ruania alba]
MSADGVSYDEFTSTTPAMMPDALALRGAIYDGATATGTVAIAIPDGTELDPAAVWVIESWSEDTAYFGTL